MTNEVNCDVVVIGGGPGGYVAAIRAAQLGKNTVLVEKERLGGVCLNIGCIPSKAMIYASDLFTKIISGDAMGITVENPSFDFAKMQEWKNGVVSKLTNGVEFLCKKNNITILKGTAAFDSNTQLTVTGENNTTVSFKDAIVATGSKPVQVPGFEFDEEKIISSTGALHLKEVPKNLVVIGGGYIGLELGIVYAKLGSKVTVLEMLDKLLAQTDQELVKVLTRNLQKMGVDIHLNTKANSFVDGKIQISKDGADSEIAADAVLVAVGRTPNTRDIGLDKAGVELDEKGFVKVNEKLQSSASNIYAIGDISTGWMLAHKASMQGKLVSEIICGENESVSDLLVPAVIFTDPEIAYVGYSEEQAVAEGLTVKTGRFPFSALARAMTKGKVEGYVKVVADEDDIIIGAQMVGPDVSDLISEVSLAIQMGAKLQDLANTIHPHPTLSEAVGEAAEAALKRAIHIINPK